MSRPVPWGAAGGRYGRRPMARRRTPTATSGFGAGRRESHDASAFYARFPAPALSDDEALVAPYDLPDDGCFVGDSRKMDDRVRDGSVALVVTSPPYFAHKEYEQDLGAGHVPGSYVEYLELLRDVFACCVEKLEPGGRIAVNVANLGRKPYRSLSGDVTAILSNLGLLLRGEIIWRKGEGAGGNCAWGSFRSPANPVLRDLTERVVVASKGRFDRAKSAEQRRALGLPSESTLTSDEFMEATLDVWDLAPESAKRVGHPAPFPVELPLRLIELYTYAGDLVLDPFLGSGATVVAAVRSGRRGAGYDMDPAYVALARSRLATERTSVTTVKPLQVTAFAADALTDAGFTITARKARVAGVVVDFVATAGDGATWHFDVSGAFTTARTTGLLRTDNVWKAIGRASVLHAAGVERVVLLAPELPSPRTDGGRALAGAGREVFVDAIALLDDGDRARLRTLAAGARR
jgi:DNA modification methylase